MSKILDKQTGGDHYAKRGIQPIEYITANKMDFNHGNIVKYVTREKDKDKDKDIKKIIDYAVFILKFDYGYSDDIIQRYLKDKFGIS